MGEAINLINNFKVEKVIFNCGPYNDLEKELISVLDKKRIKYYSCIKELNIDNNKLYFLQTKEYDNENDNSSVIYTELNNHKFLFMGDAGVEVEEDLIEKYNLQNIDVLKVGHQGSKTSSSKNFIDKITHEYLIISVGKKYNERTLRKIRQFYDVFANEKWSTMWTKLCWSHYREVLSLKDIDEINYYLNKCENKNLTQRQLHELIKQKPYNRLSIEVKNKLINKEQLKVNDLIPNPIIIKTDALKEDLTEYALKQLILNNLDDFLTQLGFGFTYVGNEYKLKLGNTYNYIDLLLYNIKYNCYVVV